MKVVYFIVSAMAALAIAAPSPNPDAEAEAVRAAEIEKRQTSGCGPCQNGRRSCWYCPLSNVCSYTRPPC